MKYHKNITKNNGLLLFLCFLASPFLEIRAQMDCPVDSFFLSPQPKQISMNDLNNSPEDIYHGGQYHAHILHDYESGFKLYSIAAEMGLKEARYDLAVMHYFGKGTPENKKLAFKMIKELADELMPEAEEFLAVMYYNGDGVERDLQKALQYFQKGIALENTEALLYAGLCLANSEQVDEEKTSKIVDYWTKAAKLGNDVAKVNLGLLYYDGKIVPQNYEEAFKWFAEAAEVGNIAGVFQTGLCYHNGKGVEKDIEKAIEYYKKGMEHGDVQCAHNLGSIYCYDKRNLKEAYSCYRIGANKGFKPSAEMCDKILKYVNSCNAENDK